MKIPYFIRNVYGSPQAYVADADLRHTIKMLTRRECLDDMDLTALRELGHEPMLELDPASLNIPKKYGGPKTQKMVSGRGVATNLDRRALDGARA